MSSNNNNNKRTKSMFSKVVNYFCICKKNTRPQQKQSLQPSILNPFSIQPSPNENKENEIINNVFSNNQNINIEKPPLKMTKVKIRTKYMATPIEVNKKYKTCWKIFFIKSIKITNQKNKLKNNFLIVVLSVFDILAV